MSLDLKSLEDAVAQLEEALTIYDRELAKKDPALQRLLRAAAIHT